MHETRIASFGSVASVVGSGAMFTDGFVNAAAALLVVGVLAALVGLHFAGVKVKARLTPSSSAGRRVATIAVVGMILTTAALAGVGGPASPVQTVQAGYFEGCQFDDSLTFAVGSSLGLSNQECTFWSPDEDASNLSATQAYAQILTEKDSSDAYLTTTENFENDMRSVAWAKAKISLINDLNNNVSEANATANAKAIVDDYYTVQQTNTVRKWNAAISTAEYVDDADGSVLKVHQGSPGSTWNYESGKDTYDSNVTLANGTQMWAEGIAYGGSYGNGLEDDGSSKSAVLRAYDPDSSQETDVIVAQRYYDAIHDLNDQSDQVTANIDTYANETYQAYEAGEIDSTDLASSDPTTIATQASTDYNSTGYFGLASAQLAAMGLSGNESVSHVVNTTENGSDRVIEGTLFYTGEDSQTFENGVTYDPSTLNGSVYMSVASIEDGQGNALNDSGGFYHVDENFTISSATNTQTGESLNSTQMETRDYTTTNTSKLAEEIDRLKELRAYYEEQQSGGGGISLDFGGVETGVILALLAVAFLATRD